MDQGAPSARGAGVRMRPPAVHRLVRDLGDLRADVEGQSDVLDRVLVGFGDIPASATSVMSASWWVAMNDFRVGIIVLVSALFPSNAWRPSTGTPRRR